MPSNCLQPSRNRAPPIPPTSTVSLTSVDPAISGCPADPGWIGAGAEDVDPLPPPRPQLPLTDVGAVCSGKDPEQTTTTLSKRHRGHRQRPPSGSAAPEPTAARRRAGIRPRTGTGRCRSTRPSGCRRTSPAARTTHPRVAAARFGTEISSTISTSGAHGVNGRTAASVFADRNGATMPQPSSPGTGIRFRMAATNCSSARYGHGDTEHLRQRRRHQRQHDAGSEVGERTGRADRGPSDRRADPAVLDQHRATGQRHPADGQDDQRQHERHRRIRVPQRVQGQVAAAADRGVAAGQRHRRVRELVQAQRDQPATHDEDEDPDADRRRRVGAGDRRACGDRQHGREDQHTPVPPGPAGSAGRIDVRDRWSRSPIVPTAGRAHRAEPDNAQQFPTTRCGLAHSG